MEPVTGNHPIHGHYTPGGWTAFFVVLVVVWTLAWSLLSWLAPGNDPKRMLKDVPFSMLRGGQMIGLMLGLSVVIGYIGIWWHQAIWATLDGIGAMLLLALTAPLINKVAGRTGGGLNLKRGEARTTAVVTSLLYVADGFAIRGVLPGPGSTGHDIWVGLVFYVLVVAFITVIYSLMAAPRFFSEYSIREPGADSASQYAVIASADQPLTSTLVQTGRKISLTTAVTQGNTSATTMAVAVLFLLGLVGHSAVAGVFTTWSNSLTACLVAFAFMTVVAAVGVGLLDLFVFRTETFRSIIEKDLLGPTIIMGSAVISAALCVSNLVQ
jgi:hypothetical protein